MNGELPKERIEKEAIIRVDFLTIAMICATVVTVSVIIVWGC